MLKNIAWLSLRRVNNLLSTFDPYLSQSGPSVGAPLFIVGAPRSGTTLTYQVITQQLRVGYFTSIMNYFYGAPNLVSRVLKPFYNRPAPIFSSTFGKTDKILSPAENANFWFQWFPRDSKQGHYVDPVDLQLEFYKDLIASVGSISCINEKPMVFKNLYLSMVVGALAQIFADARFIFVRRDRIYTCQSLFKARLKKTKPENWWSIKVPQYRKLLSMPLWYQVVDQVVCTENIIQDDLDRFAPSRYMTISYEDLCAQPQHVIRSIGEWLSRVGYVAYADVRLPERFCVSREKTLSDDLVEKMSKRLESLR